jgi:hypothetical protein
MPGKNGRRGMHRKGESQTALLQHGISSSSLGGSVSSPSIVDKEKGTPVRHVNTRHHIEKGKDGRRGMHRKGESQTAMLLQGISTSSFGGSVYPPSIVHEQQWTPESKRTRKKQGTPDTKRMGEGDTRILHGFSSSSIASSSCLTGEGTSRKLGKRLDMLAAFSRLKNTQQRKVSTRKTPKKETLKEEAPNLIAHVPEFIYVPSNALTYTCEV